MRIGIVNDVAVIRETLRRVVASSPRFEVAWTAASGEEAVERCRSNTPDVVLMDLLMPGIDGAEATRRIMRTNPCAILVVTATVTGNFSLVCEALNNGAFDAICTPTLGNPSEPATGGELLAKLEAAVRVTRQRSAGPPPAPLPVAATLRAPLGGASPAVTTAAPVSLVALGASTGGPAALEAVLSRWPADVPAAFVVVQHIEKAFAQSMADWLQDRCRLEVRPARDGDSPRAGVVLVAATDDHLAMRPGLTLGYQSEPVESPYRPSADVLFQSLARHWRWQAAAALLTGIGRDGAQGLLELRRRGWHTVAQDEETSVVYGMPKAAREIGAAERILPIEQVAASLANALGRLHADRRSPSA